MTRVLHVLDQPGATAEALALKLSADAAAIDQRANPDERHAWLLLGGEAMRDAAHAVGLPEHAFKLLPRPVGLHRWLGCAARPIKRWLMLADRVECWTTGVASIVGSIGCAHAIPRFGQATLCAFAEQTIKRHTDESRLSRNELRERWGVANDATVMVLLADRPGRVNMAVAGLAITLAYEALVAAHGKHGDLRLLCHPLHQRRLDAAVLAELLRHPQLIVQDPAVLTPWRVLHACDATIAPDPVNAGLAVLWANALGVPVIAGPEPCLPALSGLQHVTAARSRAPKHLADAITRLVSPVYSKPVAHQIV